MRLIREDYSPMEIDKEIVKENIDLYEYHFQYAPDKRDIFLVRSYMWYNTPKVNWYVIKIGSRSVELPAHLFVMVGDVLSEKVDWVRVDEMFMRELSTYVYTSDLSPESWVQEDIVVDEVVPEQRKCQLPFTDNIFPVMLGDDRAIFVAEKDMYVKTKDINFPNFFE